MTVEYLLVLGLMAGIVGARYWFTLRYMERQADDAYIVNLSGRQRMLSQRIMALGQRLGLDRSPGEREATHRKLMSAINSMEASHYVLRTIGENAAPPALPRRIREIYFGPPHHLDAKVRDYLRQARALAERPASGPPGERAAAQRALDASSENLLDSLDAAVDQYQLEGEGHVAQMIALQKWMTGAILVVLLLVGVFVFRPMVARILREHGALEELNENLEMRVRERSREIEELRDRYYHSVNHELRNPITCINGALVAFLDQHPKNLDPRLVQLLNIALRNARRLTAMIDDLVSLTGAATGKLSLHVTATPPAEVIGQTVESLRMLSAVKEIRLEAELPENLPLVLADPERLAQILTNLIGNAVKFTPPNGTITVRAGFADEDEGFLRISVRDTGCGIGPGDQARVFERLYQVAPRSSGQSGLGLGLYITKQIVDRHGGRIWVNSEPGRGSTFFFTLPVHSGHKN